MPTNHQILLDNRPQGEATTGNFKLVEVQTPALQDGQFVRRLGVRTPSEGGFQGARWPRCRAGK